MTEPQLWIKIVLQEGRGKYVLVDFWPFCRNCLSNILNLFYSGGTLCLLRSPGNILSNGVAGKISKKCNQFKPTKSNKIYDLVSLSRNKCHAIGSVREDHLIIWETTKRTMHLNMGIEFSPFYASLPPPTSSRCCG